MKTNKRNRQKTRSVNGKRSFKLSKKGETDFLNELKGKLENEHIKKYTFIVKGSKLYTQGIFWSEKNQCKYVFRSTYEFGFFYLLENDKNVLSYIVEPFDIPYMHPKYQYMTVYKPDVIVYYADGSTKLLEIKPKSKLQNIEVRAKAIAAKDYLKKNMPFVKYEFITEEQIFNSPSDYQKLLGKIDPEKAAKRQEHKEKKKVEKKIIQSEKKQVSKAVAKALSELPQAAPTEKKGWLDYKKPRNEHYSQSIEEYFRTKLPANKKNAPINVI